MIIKNIIYKKENKSFEIILDNQTNFNIIENTLIKFNLYKGQEINDEEISNIIFQNDINIASELVFKFLKNLKTKKEVINFLNSKNINRDIIDQTVENLVEKKYIDDSNYASLFVKDKLSLNKYGSIKIKMLLQNKGISKEIIEETFANLNENFEIENLEKIAEKKLKILGTTKNTYYKLANHLIRKGYKYEDVKNVLKNMEVK